MESNGCLVLLVNLLQDVNILRPLAYMGVLDLKVSTLLFITHDFRRRDHNGVWSAELATMAQELGITTVMIKDAPDAQRHLQNRFGVLVTASESNLRNHALTHNILLMAPESFLKVTLQHGLECVGFMQSRDHDKAHGTSVSFAADIICGWCASEQLRSVLPSQRDKLLVTGPTALLQQPQQVPKIGYGLVCENLHSARLKTAGDFKGEFISSFNMFCEALASKGHQVALRPHPGGQYMLRQGVPLPINCTLNNQPIYRANLSQYAYGISAPSSVLLDLVLAGVPTAVWRDSGGLMDADIYQDLASVSSAEEWVTFAEQATAHPEFFIEQQQHFLSSIKLQADPQVAYHRLAELIKLGLAPRAHVTIGSNESRQTKRVLIVANAMIPTVQLVFGRPLDQLQQDGSLKIDYLTEDHMREFADKNKQVPVADFVRQRLEAIAPDILVFCRYSGPFVKDMTDWAKHKGVPLMFQIDDDLLNVPIELGETKYQFHNAPNRLATVRHLLDETDLVFAANDRLHHRLEELGAKAPIIHATMVAAGRVVKPAALREVRRIGYMGFDHAHDLKMVSTALIAILTRYPTLEFHLFGSIPKPAAFNVFGDRVTVTAPVRDYDLFIKKLASLDWDIGIAPLVKTSFNMTKSNNKWVEYSSVGAAVVASVGTVYDSCCANGCGMLVEGHDAWVAALEGLINDPLRRFQMVQQAQTKIETEFSMTAMRREVVNALALAESLAKNPPQMR